MFNTLESAWDRSARRGWTTLASFGLQAMALSLLLVVPLIWVQGPPTFTWSETLRFLAPPAAAPPAPAPGQPHHQTASTNLAHGQIVEPSSIPDHVAILNEPQVAAAPDIDRDLVPGAIGTGPRGRGIADSIGRNVEIVPPPPAPTQAKPFHISEFGAGYLMYRVQPVYPQPARLARIQGPVLLRAIVGKTGTIENLQVISGHPMLVRAAIDAVRQWRYRPYLLNHEPIEVETEITVNFILAGN